MTSLLYCATNLRAAFFGRELRFIQEKLGFQLSNILRPATLFRTGKRETTNRMARSEREDLRRLKKRPLEIPW